MPSETHDHLWCHLPKPGAGQHRMQRSAEDQSQVWCPKQCRATESSAISRYTVGYCAALKEKKVIDTSEDGKTGYIQDVPSPVGMSATGRLCGKETGLSSFTAWALLTTELWTSEWISFKPLGLWQFVTPKQKGIIVINVNPIIIFITQEIHKDLHLQIFEKYTNGTTSNFKTTTHQRKQSIS